MVKFEVGKYYVHKIDNLHNRYCSLLVCLEVYEKGAILYDCAAFLSDYANINNNNIELLKPILDFVFSYDLVEDYLIFRINEVVGIKRSPVQFSYNTSAWYNKYKLIHGIQLIEEMKKRGY